MNSNLFMKAVVISVIAFALSFVCYEFSGDFLDSTFPSQWLKQKEKLDYRTFNESVSLKDINSIVVESENANVYIRHSDKPEGKIEFTVSGEYQQQLIRMAKQDHLFTLKIADVTKYPDSAVTIYLPASVTVVNVDNRVGNTGIDHVNVNSLFINTVAGDIKLNQVNALLSNIMSVGGDIYWKGSSKKMDIKSVSGDVDVESSDNAPSYDIKTVSGDVNVVVAKPINAEVDMQSFSGNVSSNHSIALSNGAHGFIKIRSVSGDIQVDGK